MTILHPGYYLQMETTGGKLQIWFQVLITLSVNKCGSGLLPWILFEQFILLTKSFVGLYNLYCLLDYPAINRTWYLFIGMARAKRKDGVLNWSNGKRNKFYNTNRLRIQEIELPRSIEFHKNKASVSR